MRLRWLGPGSMEFLVGDRIHVAYAGDVVDVSRERAEILIQKGMATANVLERIDVGYDIDHLPPTKAERELHERHAQKTHDQTQTILREMRLRDCAADVSEISQVPITEGEG